jgi:hypothetical protein
LAGAEDLLQGAVSKAVLMSSEMQSSTSTNFDQTLDHFRERGWMRVRRAFDADAAASMRDVVWSELERRGILRDQPETWTVERPEKLQKLKDHPAFAAVGSARLLDAIGAILGVPFAKPKRWGAAFLAFPSKTEWAVPSGGWHCDAHYTSPLWPPNGVQTFALFGDLQPRSGATQILAGAHRLIHRWFVQNPPPPDAHSIDMRKSLLGHPYIRDLHKAGDRDQRIARFLNTVEVVDAIPLQVVETTGEAGDVIVLHPLALHVGAPNNGVSPRFMLSGAVTTDLAGWGAKP